MMKWIAPLSFSCLLLAPNVAVASNAYGATAACTIPTSTTATCTFPAIPAYRTLLVKNLFWQCSCTNCFGAPGSTTSTVTFKPETGSASLTMPITTLSTSTFVSGVQISNPIGMATDAAGISAKASSSMSVAISVIYTPANNATLSVCSAWVTGTLTP